MKVLIFLLAIGLALAPKVNHGQQQFSGGAALNEAVMAETFKQITSVVVSVAGEKRYEAYWGEGSKTLMNDTRSAMKTLTALAVGAAIDDGLIASVDDKAWDWFEPEKPFRYPTELKAGITIADLLTMSSALDCNDNVWETPGNEEHMYPARRWVLFGVDLPTKEGYVRDSNGRGPFAYCTVGSFLLGQIVQRAAGEPVDSYIQRRILSPLGITKVNWDRSPSGEVMTGGGVEMTSLNLLSLAELILGRGKFQGKQLISGAWIDHMLSQQVQADPPQSYGYQIWHELFDCGDEKISGWYMGGNGGNKVAIFPQVETVAVVTATLYGTRGMHQQSTDILNQYVLPSLKACQLQL